ncbi:hypothetical protein [Noviherbaspirillum sp. UKPF54]|uniref:hypothetical protein n=1 Tax=Noviherbaspirillum sp. UKPF54 TaxID=2601898 RepID=UPI0011B18196|nr:hypothetical protein [Noviherbaspirillum sp. UKPF54]QDZ28697.1 hypothetical protein FAY22_12495 [Noviherbaspirillum sp. UKPF54]
MPRPLEYDNLININAFAEKPATPGALEAYLRNAQSYLAAAKLLDPAVAAMPVFSTAYEGFFQLVQAVFEFYEVRTKDSGRNLAIQRVCKDLGMNTAEQALVAKAHERRNDTSYRSPFPPVSKAEAQSLVAILDKYVPVAYKLVNVPYP